MNMDEEIEFKFNPIWVSLYGAPSFFFIYLLIDDIINTEETRHSYIGLLIITVSYSWLYMPNLIKMLIGMPALKLTNDKLIFNINKLHIAWTDISGFRIKNTGNFIFLIVKLVNHEKYVDDTGMRRIFNYLRGLSDNEVAANILFIKGSDDRILSTIRNYKYTLIKK